MAESRFSADLQRARTALIEAELAERPSDRFLAAHLAALRVAARWAARKRSLLSLIHI